MTSIPINEIFTFVLSLLLLIIGNYFFPKWTKKKDESNKRNQWIEALRLNKEIDSCLSKYESGKYPQGSASLIFAIFVVIASMVGARTSFMYLYKQADGNLMEAFIDQILVITLISMLMLMISTFIVNYMYNRDEAYLIKHSNLVANLYKDVYFVIFAGIITSIVIFINSLNTNIVDFYTDIQEIIIQFSITIFAMVAVFLTIHLVNITHSREFGNSINESCLQSYPVVEIITKECSITGKVKSIFDENFIIIVESNMLTIVEWNQILTIKICDISC
ncbi:hypothetical protein MettiDRAFT_2348 [Methanolobus tindarius DSM 2278]|uniref:Uncharacterized protein n=1 Tax=Methanolobus tindarius DSM 2278 TaxID=1090322 RepID=W9DYS1_METTI|nr:hypothetical protein [Methanolobus tindarius]ETA68862.1 hypothetical protein MettiDRAFT_2348 [Methanolobus tindarius DSM 2278]